MEAKCILDENKEPALFVCCVAKKVKDQPKSTLWLKKLKKYAFSSAQKHFKNAENLQEMKFVLYCFSEKSAFTCKSPSQMQ